MGAVRAAVHGPAKRRLLHLDDCPLHAARMPAQVRDARADARHDWHGAGREADRQAMDIQRYHHDHARILEQIDALRALARAGVREHAEEIGQLITGTASHIKFHLAAEDQVLYPTLARCGKADLAAMSERYRIEMQGLAEAFAGFVRQWRVPARLAADPEGFRRDANTVLRALFERLQRENAELYPAAGRA